MTIINLDSNKVGKFWRIARRLPDIHFLAVMGGYGHQVVPRRLPRNVTVIGHVAADRMDLEVWSRTRLLLVPSARESWGMTATEALQRGIPVIASPTPGLLESLGSAGVFIDRKRTREWVRQIRLLHADGMAYARRSAECRRRGRELFEQSLEQLKVFCDTIERLVDHA